MNIGRIRKASFIWISGVAATALGGAMILGACANVGNPSGGPRDEDPPIFVSANPPMGSVNVNKEKITLTFNELINVKDAFNKVVVSPPIGSQPRVTSLGRRVSIEFDSLAPNTTYTVDFADAIEDNNEANQLQGFAYTFSTGPDLDSLRISGRVLSARAMEPQQSILVGVHSNMSDTAFTKTRFLRMAKTDDRGRFTIRGLAPGSYRVFALKDNDNDYTYSSPEEDIAFYDVLVSPTSQQVTAIDSVYNPQTGKLDTVVERQRTQFLPNDILLRSFNSEIRQQYMTKYERIDSTRIYIKMNTRSDSLPKIRILNPAGLQSASLGTLEASQKLDSLVWWLPQELMRTDSLQLEVAYTRTDQNFVPEAVTDTLNFFTKRAPQPKKNKKEKKRISAADSIAAITTQFNMLTSSSQHVNKPVEFELPAPSAEFHPEAFRLSVLVDSVYQPVPEKFLLERPDPLNPRRFILDYNWDYDTKYKLEADTLAAIDIYGKPSRPLTHEFTTKKTGDYCSILFQINGLPAGMPAFMELLNGSDAVQRTATVENNEAYFPYLEPGKYYARIVFDSNGNGEYDTGNLQLNRQPELVYYYPKVINMKKNWDKEEVWALWDTPVDMMKPAAVTKNKPATDKRRRNNNDQNVEEEEEDYFDPTENPFDPNDKAKKRRQRRTAGSY